MNIFGIIVLCCLLFGIIMLFIQSFSNNDLKIFYDALLKEDNKKIIILGKDRESNLLNKITKKIKQKNKKIEQIYLLNSNEEHIDILSENFFNRQKMIIIENINKYDFLKKEDEESLEEEYVILTINKEEKDDDHIEDIFENQFYLSESFFIASSIDPEFIEKNIFKQFELYITINWVKKTWFGKYKYNFNLDNYTNDFVKNYWNIEYRRKKIFKKNKYKRNITLYL